MSQPLVSVIIPCYKQAHFLPECIASLQAQTMPDWEAIVVDDGSPDDTVSVALKLIAADSRIKLVQKKNGGLSSARNAGIAVSSGRYIQFLDADDYLYPSKFEIQTSIANTCREDTITYTDYMHGDEKYIFQEVYGYRLSIALTMKNPLNDFSSRWEHDLSIPIHTPLFPGKLLKENDIYFDDKLQNHEDWDFWMRIVNISNSVLFIPEVLAIYRISKSSMSRNKELMWDGFRKAIAKQKAIHRNNYKTLFYLSWLSYRNDFLHNKGFARHIRRLMQLPGFSKMPKCIANMLMGKTKWLGFTN